jgi:hydrogenase expression/formation protein HypC
MCLGVPGLVVDRLSDCDELAMAIVEFDGLRRRVCIACVPECRPGDYVLVHAGIAISRIDPDEARRVFEFLEAGGDRDGWDVDREEASREVRG